MVLKVRPKQRLFTVLLVLPLLLERALHTIELDGPQITAQSQTSTLDTESGPRFRVLAQCLLVLDFTIILIFFCLPFVRCLLLKMGFKDASPGRQTLNR